MASPLLSPAFRTTPGMLDSDLLRAGSADELAQLQGKFKSLPQQLAAASDNLSIVIDLATESRVVPINEIIPMGKNNTDSFAALRQLRNDFTGRVIIFRNVLLPLSQQVVNGLHTFLEWMSDKHTFLELAKTGEVTALCAEQAEEALTVQNGYECLASDLLNLGHKIEDVLGKVSLDVDKLIADHQASQKWARKLKIASGTIGAAGVVGGVIALGVILGPLAPLVAGALAPAVFGALVAGGGAAATVAGTAAHVKSEKGVALRAGAEALHNAHGMAQQQLPNAVDRFAGAMESLAGFFTQLHSSVKRIETSAARIASHLQDDFIRARYEALYSVLCEQLVPVKQSCQEYSAFVAHVNIRVNNLQLTHDKPIVSYIEDWFEEQQAQRAGHDHDASKKLQRLEGRWSKTCSGARSVVKTVHDSFKRRPASTEKNNLTADDKKEGCRFRGKLDDFKDRMKEKKELVKSKFHH